MVFFKCDPNKKEYIGISYIPTPTPPELIQLRKDMLEEIKRKYSL